jgi:signal transduction histidine kinase
MVDAGGESAIFGRPSPSIRLQLMRVVVAAALPVWLASAFLLYRTHIEERATIEQNASATVRTLMVAIDLDLAGAKSAAQTLATSPYLVSDDLGAFYAQATAVLRSGVGDNVVLTDASGQQLLNTLKPFGTALPRHGNPDQLRKVFETSQPLISDVYLGGVLRRPVLSIDVPVFSDGKVAYDLSIGLFPERLGDILRQQQLPAGWVASVFDSKGYIVARTHAPEQFVGKKGAPLLVEQIAKNREGSVQTDTLEGIPVTAIYSRSGVSNWAVAIGVPTAELTARLWRSLAMSIAGTLLLVALGVAAAGFLGERLARPIRALTAPALAHGRGQRINVPQLGLKEADDVGRALMEGSRLLEQRTAERDQTERARQQIFAAKEQAEHAARLRSAYFANLSHELRSPLNAIIGMSQFMASPKFAALGSPRYLEYCNLIEKAGNHLLTLINEILDYAKFEANEIVINREPVDVEDEIRGAVGLLAAQAEQAGVRLRHEVAPNLPALWVDPTRLRQVLLNLLSNAVKFTPQGGTVSITGMAADGQAVIRVEDTGVGIAPDDLARVVLPFTQANHQRTRRGEGTGLGLPLSKGLVELHGGTFEIASQPGLGTTVTIRFPISAAANRDERIYERSSNNMRVS